MKLMRVWGSLLGLGLGLGLAVLPAASAQQQTAQQAAQRGTYSSTDAPPSANLSLNDRADLLMARREYPAAIRLMEDAIHHHQGDAGTYNRLGIAYQQSNNLGKAAKYYKSAMKMDRHSATYVNNLGTVYFMQRKNKDAAKQFNAAIQLDNTVAVYYVNLGGAEYALKQYDGAFAAFRSALRLDPDSLIGGDNGNTIQDVSYSDTPAFHYDLSRLFCSMGMLDNAMHQFRRASELHYKNLKASLTDPVFAPLRQRPEYRTLMGLPPLPATGTGG